MCQNTGLILPPSFQTHPFSLSLRGHTNRISPKSNSLPKATQMATIPTCFTITPTSRLLTFTAPPFHKPFIFPQNRRINKRVPRAAVGVGRGIRPGGVVESDKLSSDVRKRTMDAVDGCGGRVTVGDVASRAGLKLNEAQKALQALAADTDGFLEVCIVFSFILIWFVCEF